MKLSPINNIKTKSEAKQIAIDWQNWLSGKSVSYGEILAYQEYFTNVANKFDLTEEFKENGII